MDFFDGQNYRMNKTLLSIIGQWPYQSPRTSYAIVFVLTTVFCSQFLTKLCGMFNYIHDMDIVIECLVAIMVDVSSMTKVMNSMLCVDKVRMILDQIRNDFYSLRNSDELKILQEYADRGKKSSVGYVWMMYITMVIFMLMPFQPLILQVANATTRPMLHRVEYYIDMDKYYFPIVIHGYITCFISITTITATDAIFIIFVQHVCGLFMVTGARIDQAIQEIYLIGNGNFSIKKDKAYQNMIQCVYDHKSAIRFVDLMEMVYSKHFLFHAGLNMIAMSVTSVGALTKSDDLSELLRLSAVSCALLFHLCFECVNAQRLMDSSADLQINLINSNWYNASPRTKKLILFMTMKVQTPCVLTAGGMFVLCMETFATIVKTAVSYFTFLRSAY